MNLIAVLDGDGVLGSVSRMPVLKKPFPCAVPSYGGSAGGGSLAKAYRGSIWSAPLAVGAATLSELR